MAKLKLTDTIVQRSSLPEGKVDLDLWDSELRGFGLRIRPNSKSWIIVYRPVGTGRSANPTRMKIGTTKTIATATEARRLAKAMLGKIAAGADPLAERRVQKVRDRAKLADVIDRYEKDLERRNYVNCRVVVAGFRTKMAPFLGRDIADITGAELARIIEQMEAAGKPGGAKNFRSRARAFFGWAVTKAHVLDVNPLAGHRKERATRADKIAKAEHGRALSDAELVRVWNAADQATVIGRLIRFYILTGCRRGEGAGLTWSMIDRKAKLLDLPAVFVKQGRGHVVPIAPALAAILKACARDARSDLVFASARSGGKMSGWTQFTDQINKASGVAFLLHDLRRTFRTGLSRIGVDADTAELALGHARSDLEAVYNRDTAVETLRTAFEKWAEHIEKIVAAKRAAELFA